MPGNADTRYDYTRPWQTNEQRLTGEALAAAALNGPRDPIYQTRPPLPRVELFPPRFGYGDRPALGIRDIVELDMIYPGARTDYARNNSGMQGTTTPGLNVF